MTLITIISRHLSHLTPIIFEFKNRVKNHIIITDESKEDKERAEELYNGIKKLNKKYNLKSKIKVFVIDEDDKSDFNNIFYKLKKMIKSKIYLNVSEADTTLTIMMSAFTFKNKGKVISYDKNDNTYNLIYKNHFQNHIIQNSMKIEDYLTLLDYKIEDKTTAKQIVDRKIPIFRLFKNMKKINTIKYNLNHNIYEFCGLETELKELNIIDNNKILDKSSIGRLFEEYLFWKLFRFDFDDILMNVKITSDTKQNRDIMNEFDVIMIKNNQIFIVEAKFGTINYKQTPNKTAGDIIYKSDSLLSLFGEDSKMLVVNISNKKLFSDYMQVRAKEHNILIYQGNKIDKDFYEFITKNTSLKEKIFLLGGKDLEMETIKAILIKYNQNVADKNLKWGAKLSSYKKTLNKKYHFYGIELDEDIQTPKFYTKIDHHNELSQNPSSIEQIADILDIKLNKYEKLVALNDKGYIPAMEKFGATKQEINQIRQQDRVIQGVTQTDEILAKKSIQNISIENNINVVYAFSDKFSAIIDRLYPMKNVIIYNDNKLVFYGDIKPLIKKFDNLIKNNQAYYGGGKNGFFGIKENIFTSNVIKDIKKDIISLNLR